MTDTSANPAPSAIMMTMESQPCMGGPVLRLLSGHPVRYRGMPQPGCRACERFLKLAPNANTLSGAECEVRSGAASGLSPRVARLCRQSPVFHRKSNREVIQALKRVILQA